MPARLSARCGPRRALQRRARQCRAALHARISGASDCPCVLCRMTAIQYLYGHVCRRVAQLPRSRSPLTLTTATRRSFARSSRLAMPLTTPSVYPPSSAEFMKWPSRRSVVHSTKGIVACTQPLAAKCGIDILNAGGNAAVSGLPLDTGSSRLTDCIRMPPWPLVRTATATAHGPWKQHSDDAD